VLTSAANGRFSDNGFFVRPDTPTEIEFYAFEYGGRSSTDEYMTRQGHEIRVKELLHTLNATLRVEHLWPVLHLMSTAQPRKEERA
jgi:hypothetical protein